MPFLDTENLRIFYAVYSGDGSSSCSLVLIHGAGGSHLDWPPQIRRLSPYRVNALDLPGHGRSSSPGLHSIAEYAGAVRSFIDTLDEPHVILVGHSMGGAIVQTLGLDPPSNVVGMVLIASGARLRVAPEIMEGVQKDFTRAVERITALAWSDDAPPEMTELGKRLMLRNDPNVMYGDFQACDHFDLMDRLDQIDLPTLVICGSADRLTPAKFSHYMAGEIDGSRLELIEGAGHMVMLEKPEVTAKVILQFGEYYCDS